MANKFEMTACHTTVNLRFNFGEETYLNIINKRKIVFITQIHKLGFCKRVGPFVQKKYSLFAFLRHFFLILFCNFKRKVPHITNKYCPCPLYWQIYVYTLTFWKYSLSVKSQNVSMGWPAFLLHIREITDLNASPVSEHQDWESYSSVHPSKCCYIILK